MKRQLSIIVLLLMVAALISASGIALADDSDQGGFAQTAPAIPGYNAQYPTQAGRAAGFATTAPSIPGYNAAYPSMAALIRATAGSWSATAPSIPGIGVASAPAPRGSASVRLQGFSAAMPGVPGYNMAYPVVGIAARHD